MTMSSAAVACASVLRPARSRARESTSRARSVIARRSPGVIRSRFRRRRLGPRAGPGCRAVQLEGQVAYFAYYLVKLPERVRRLLPGGQHSPAPSPARGLPGTNGL